jgi:hypothetical protein
MHGNATTKCPKQLLYTIKRFQKKKEKKENFSNPTEISYKRKKKEN